MVDGWKPLFRGHYRQTGLLIHELAHKMSVVVAQICRYLLLLVVIDICISFICYSIVTATADVSGCSVWVCGTCDAKASSYLGSGRMTEVIRLALYTEVLGPWDSDCAGGRLLSTDTGLADLLPLGLLNTSSLSTISSYGSISIYLYQQDQLVVQITTPAA